VQNLLNSLSILKTSLEAVKVATKGYGFVYTHKALSGDAVEWGTETVQIQLRESNFNSLIEALELTDEVFYHNGPSHTCGFVNVSECQFYYIVKAE